MEKIWKAAFAVAGLGAVAFFVFFSLYQQWLTLPIFEKLSQTQTFAVMVIFLLLAFSALVAGLLAWFRGRQTPAPAGPAAPEIEATRDFFVGRWEVQQKSGEIEGGSYMDYFADGRVSGVLDRFVNGQGQRVPIHGVWKFERLSQVQFRLAVTFDGGGEWMGVFRILDRNRIHNTGENYSAVRVER